MATETIGSATSSTTKSSSSTKLVSDNSQVSKDQFLQLLVTQLQNQDPLEPMKNEDFAVNLAQFSQLEQLVSINEKLSSPSSDSTSLASYLGHEVSLSSSQVEIGNGSDALLRIKLAQDADDVAIDLTDANGATVATLNLGELSKGSHTVSLADSGVANGSYGFSVRSTGAGGETIVPTSVAGLVSGFVPGPEAKLVVGNRELLLSDVTEVRVPSVFEENT
jgi:flagellar basal-body rod modification protein FlgD